MLLSDVAVVVFFNGKGAASVVVPKSECDGVVSRLAAFDMDFVIDKQEPFCCCH